MSAQALREFSLFPDEILPTSRLIRILVPCLVADVIDITPTDRNVYNLREHLGSHILPGEKNENKLA